MPYIEQIWHTRILTNAGEFHRKLELELAKYLEVPFVSLFNNGTTALLVALKMIGRTGEVITTPFSFAATSHSILWSGCTPVFADVLTDGFNIDPIEVRTAITSKTVAILPVHCYGYPCDVTSLREIAEHADVPVIYDAAHAFGVKAKGRSILTEGTLSVLSFHATKVFNTFEGGAIVSPDEKTKEKIDALKNFGIQDEATIPFDGINGKMAEINAALGLAQLPHLERQIQKRLAIDASYRQALAGVRGISIPDAPQDVTSNGSYFPILVEAGYRRSRDELYENLKAKGILARRYFWPLLADLPSYAGLPSAAGGTLPRARHLAASVLCLPIFADMTEEEFGRVVEEVAA